MYVWFGFGFVVVFCFRVFGPVAFVPIFQTHVFRLVHTILFTLVSSVYFMPSVQLSVIVVLYLVFLSHVS